MNHNNGYATHRDPQAKNTLRSRPFLVNKESGIISDSQYNSYTLGRRERENFANSKASSKPIVSPTSPSVANRIAGLEGAAGISGHKTLPSKLHRPQQDPLNNASSRFNKKAAEPAPLNNFSYYRSQQETSSPKSPPQQSQLTNKSYVQSKAAQEVQLERGWNRSSSQDHNLSLLLTQDENLCVAEMLGNDRQSLATAVARILVPSSGKKKWKVKDSITGVVCLVKDTAQMSHFILGFSMQGKNYFCQEIYNLFEYQAVHTSFFTFEGDSSVVGILFADRTEVSSFRRALDAVLEAEMQRNERVLDRERRKSQVFDPQDFSYNRSLSKAPAYHKSMGNLNATSPSFLYGNGSKVSSETWTNYNATVSPATFEYNRFSKPQDNTSAKGMAANYELTLNRFDKNDTVKSKKGHRTHKLI